MSTRQSSFRDFDWFLFAIVLLLVGVGMLQIFSATYDTKFRDIWWKQITFLGISIVLMWIATQIDYHTLLAQSWFYYIAGIVLLLVTMLVGGQIFGSRRWIGYGAVRFQTSEFFKIVLVLIAAKYLSELRGKTTLELKDLLKLGGMFILPMALVMMQPDLGTSLTFFPILGAGVFLAGMKWKHLATLLIAGVVMLPVAWFGLKDYQKGRVLTFLDPSRDPKGAGYQVIQSKIAIGSGGVWGQGATKGNQTQLRFLPVAHTDFIFASFAEEHGFVGVSVVLALYFLLLLQIVQNAQGAPDRAGLFICMGVAALILFHLFVNIGMVAGKMPITGIPLPFISSGGSHMMAMFILLGLVNNVRLRRFA